MSALSSARSNQARRVIFRRYGGIDALEVERFAPEKPARGEVAIDVAFCGVNFADVIARRGFYKWAPPPPTCVGFEVSGAVSEVGEDVKTLRIGDRVAAVVRFGGCSSRVVTEEARAWKLLLRA